MTDKFFSTTVAPDWESFVSCIGRKGTPSRVHYIELFLDPEMQAAICSRFNLLDGLRPEEPFYDQLRQIRLQRFLGYDYVRCGLEGLEMPLLHSEKAADTADLKRQAGRCYIDEHKGPITNWAEFEKYPWPDPEKSTTRTLEWYEKNLPDDMCVIASGGFAHFAEYLNWLMGYETLCYALCDQRDLVKAIADRLLAMYRVVVRRMLEFTRVKIVWGSDDMGFRSGTLIGPDNLREFVFPGHKLNGPYVARGWPALIYLHSCGKLTDVMNDLIDDVRIDAKHSFEDTIEECHRRQGRLRKRHRTARRDRC